MIHPPNPLIAIGVVASTAATDAVYVLFTAAVAARRRSVAASWSSVWYLLSAFAVISYTGDPFAAAHGWEPLARSPGWAGFRKTSPLVCVNVSRGNTVPETTAKCSKWNDIEVESLSPLIGRQMIVGTNLMVARVLLKKGARVPLHSHHNEQVTYILEGALHFSLDNREITVPAGEVLCIPPHMPHEAVALEDTVDLDIFNPPRQDWIDKDDAYLRQEAPVKT